MLHLRSLSVVLFLSLLLLPTATYAQDDVETRFREGIRLVDAGEYDKGWEVFEELRKSHPHLSAIRYEQAYIRMAQERYRDAIKILEAIVEAPDRTAQYFQQLGNCYDYIDEKEKAIETYYRGLRIFPEAGELYVDLGVALALGDRYDEAVEIWEKGLTVDPEFPSNYLHTANYFLQTNAPGWGHIYGEIFLNLEPHSQRSAVMRRELWKSMVATFSPDHDQVFSVTVDGVKPSRDGDENDSAMNMALQLQYMLQTVAQFPLFPDTDTLTDEVTGERSLGFPAYVKNAALTPMLSTGIEEGDLTIRKLHDYRNSFLESWYADTVAAGFYNVSLYAYQRALQQEGLLEAYDYHLFSTPATETEYRAWAADHAEDLQRLETWLTSHPYDEYDDNPFSRTTMKRITLVGDKE